MPACQVSHHAMVRWIERVKGIDLGPLRITAKTDHELLMVIEHKTGLSRKAIIDEILAGGVREAIEGGAWMVMKPDRTVVAQGMMVVTVLGPGESPHRNARQRRMKMRGAKRPRVMEFEIEID